MVNSWPQLIKRGLAHLWGYLPPPVDGFAAFAIVGLLIAGLIIFVVRLFTGNISILFGLIHVRDPETANAELREQIADLSGRLKELGGDDSRKEMVLIVIKDALREVSKAGSGDEPIMKRTRIDKCYELLLTGLHRALSEASGGYHRVAFLVPTEEGGELMFRSGLGFSPEGLEHFRLNISDGVAGYAFSHNQEAYVPDVMVDPRFVQHPKASKSYRTLFCVPVGHIDAPLGVLSLDGMEDDCFTDQDKEFARLFSNAIALLRPLDLEKKEEASP